MKNQTRNKSVIGPIEFEYKNCLSLWIAIIVQALEDYKGKNPKERRSAAYFFFRSEWAKQVFENAEINYEAFIKFLKNEKTKTRKAA
jgi:hypothetical protein